VLSKFRYIKSCEAKYIICIKLKSWMIYYNKDIIGCLKVLESKYLVDLMLDKFGCISWMFA